MWLRKKLNKIIIFFLPLLIISLCLGGTVWALSSFSDTISNSAPGVNSDHIIIFKNNHAIPASGTLVITPPAGLFFIMANFDFTEVDLATSSSRNGSYQERTLAALATTEADGVSVIASSTNGSITITLNSSNGINSNEYVRIKLGQVSNWQDNGVEQIINPTATGPYMINVKTYSDSGGLLDSTGTFIFMIEPVAMSSSLGKIRWNGTPSGVLTFGTVSAILSLTTNYIATCRFSDTASTSYADITDQFSYTGQNFHSYLLTGLVNDGDYTYYVRCRDSLNIDDDTDYIITFKVAAQEGNEGEEAGNPGGGGGGTGGGGGGGSGPSTGKGVADFLPFPPLPGSPSLVLQGLAYQSSEVTLLQDGLEQQKVNADSKAQFIFGLYDLKQGVYSFGVRAVDPEKRKSLTQTFTFWIKEGTKTEIYKIFIPPTIELGKSSITAGETIQVFGRTAPNSDVEVWLYPQSIAVPTSEDIVKAMARADISGRWSATVSTADTFKGVYKVKARANIVSFGQSDFSQVLSVGIGVSAGTGLCPGADLNKDGRVNLFDFSILLYYWGTDNACADQNQDGKVDLIDFSIMMYYWTG